LLLSLRLTVLLLGVLVLIVLALVVLTLVVLTMLSIVLRPCPVLLVVAFGFVPGATLATGLWAATATNSIAAASVPEATLVAIAMSAMGTGGVTEELSLKVVEAGLDQTFHLLLLALLTLLLEVDARDPELDFDRRKAERPGLIEAADGVLCVVNGLVEDEGVLESRL